MQIGFNAQRLTGQRLGVGRYLEYLLRHWSQMLSDSETVECYLRDPIPPKLLEYLDLSQSVIPRVIGPRLKGVFWENLPMSRAARKTDVLFGPSYTLPVRFKGRSVVAIHSVNEVLPGAHPWWYDYTWGERYKLSARRADVVIASSESTKHHIVERYGLGPDKIEVVYQGADDSFRPLDDQSLLRDTRVRFFGSDRPYILYVGQMSLRRNIPLLLEAFGRLRRETNLPHGLLLFGPNLRGLDLPELFRQFDIENDVVQTDGKIDNHSDLIPIYNAADVFLHPSSYEGWSMTTVEALACGTPFIAANRGGIGEFADGYGYMIDEPTSANFFNALNEVLSDDSLRRELKVKARERGASVNWQYTTGKTLEIVRRVGAMG